MTADNQPQPSRGNQPQLPRGNQPQPPRTSPLPDEQAPYERVMEDPSTASDDSPKYKVVHTLVGPFEVGRVISEEMLHEHADVDRLLALGAIEHTDEPITLDPVAPGPEHRPRRVLDRVVDAKGYDRPDAVDRLRAHEVQDKVKEARGRRTQATRVEHIEAGGGRSAGQEVRRVPRPPAPGPGPRVRPNA